MRKLMSGVVLATGLLSSGLNAEVEIVNLRIMDEYNIEANRCSVQGMSETDFIYSLGNKKGSSECEKLKKLNLKGGNTYKMKVDIKDVGEESCIASFIEIIK